MFKVISTFPGASYFQRPAKGERDIEKEEALTSELEALVAQHEELRRIEVFSSTFTEYRKKSLEEYTAEDFQSM